MRRAAGSRSGAMTRRWVRGRWRARSRSTSSGPWRKRCYSAGWWAAGTCGFRWRRTARSSTWNAPRIRLRSLPPEESATPVDDPALGEVIGRHFHRDLVAGEDADVVFPHLAGNMRGNHVAVLQLHAEGGVGQRLHYLTFHLDRVFFGHTALSSRGARIGAQRPRVRNLQ